MRDLLSITPARSLILGGVLVLGTAGVALLDRTPAPVVIAPEIIETATEDELPELPELPASIDEHDAIVPLDDIEDPADFTFAFELGGTGYIRLADSELDTPQASARLVESDVITSAIAAVRAKDVPATLRPWKGRKVLVGGTCTATVVGFVEIARVAGDPRYGDGGDGDNGAVSWTVESTFSSGKTMIAGRLDRLCEGTWARAADRAPIGLAIELHDQALDHAVRTAFLGSSHATEIATAWTAAKQHGDWRDGVGLSVELAQHSTTGARWAYVHAHKPGDCGEYGVNVAVTYRIDPDGSLREVDAGALPGRTLGALLDLNGDGWFERLIDTPSELERALVGPTDDIAHASISVPFHGCGC